MKFRDDPKYATNQRYSFTPTQFESIKLPLEKSIHGNYVNSSLTLCLDGAFQQCLKIKMFCI